MSNGASQPDPEIIPPGQDAKNGGGESRSPHGTPNFDDLTKVLDHPMTWPRATYVMYALSVVSGFPMLIGLIVAYVARGEAPEWQKTHYTFLIRTFWYFVVLFAVGMVLAVFLVGFMLLWVLPLWVAIRAIRGWMLLEDKKPIPDPESWLFG
ncbi:DUF4870 family protein [Pseudomonadota bacterium]